MFTVRNTYLYNRAYLLHQHNKEGEAWAQVNHSVSTLTTKNYYQLVVHVHEVFNLCDK